MSNTERREAQVLCALLAYELFGAEISIDAVPLNWGELLSLANDHAVTPLMYSGVRQVPGVPQNVFDLIERLAVRSTIQADRSGQIQSEVLQKFQEHGIHAVVLKGTSLAMNYPHPEVRLTGDIDVLVAPADLDKCGEVLLQAGYTLEKVSGIHACYRSRQVLIEVHQAVSRYPETPKGEYTRALMQSALAHVRTGCLGQHEFPMLDEPFYTLALLSHMEKHMGTTGIGLRQLCDWATAVCTLSADEGARLLPVLEKCGLLKYAQVLTAVCQRYLRMPECAWMPACSDDLAAQVMDDILSVGNFQAQLKNRPFGSALIDPYDLKGDGKRRRLTTYLRRVRRKMQEEYPWAKSPAWLPFFGLFYFGKWAVSVLKGRISLKSTLNTMKHAKGREQLMRQMQLYK